MHWICLQRTPERMAVLEPRRHRHSHALNTVRHWGLTHSPEAHLNVAWFPPELCSGVHQKGCDLEGVQGAAPQHSLLKTMANAKFSTTLINSGQQLQQKAIEFGEAERRNQVASPFITPAPPVSPLVQGVGWTLQKAGEGLSNLGFDEAGSETFDPITSLEPLQVGAAADSVATGSIVNAFSPATSDPILNSAIADEAGSFDPITGYEPAGAMFDEGPKASAIVSTAGTGISAVGSGIAIYALKSTPVTGPVGAKVALAGAIVGGVGVLTTFTGKTLGMFGLDESEPSSIDPVVGVEGFEGSLAIPAFRDEFSSNPETLTPIDLNSAMVTDAYQHQNAPGADLIAGEPNQGMDRHQAQREQYEVLA